MLAFDAWLLSYFPKNLLSWMTGWFCSLELPWPLSYLLCQLFVSTFQIDMSEAEKPLRQYRSVQEVFTRKLKPGIRPIKGALVSPADGSLVISRPLVENHAIQAKGLDYGAKELLDLNEKEHDNLAWYSTVYLAPHNYHRVHSPVNGQLKRIRYIPGDLWPVNERFVKLIPSLFCKNERLVFTIDLEGAGRVFVVMVGAFNVGKMSSPFWENFFSNNREDPLWAKKREILLNAPVPLSAGDELGTFMLGSTVVVVLDQIATSRLKPSQVDMTKSILLGEMI